MKRSILFPAAVAVSAALSFTAPVAAQGNTKPPAPEVAEACKADFHGGRGINRGGCISFFRTDDPVSICTTLRDFGLLELFGLKSTGECIAFLTRMEN